MLRVYSLHGFIISKLCEPYLQPILLSVILSLFIPPAFSADVQAGRQAWVKRDYSTALKEYRPLAEQGHSEAQYRLGNMYFLGEGVIQDYVETIKWFTLAAEQGYMVAQRRLGGIYSSYYLGLLDYEAALKWYTLAAEQGSSDAQFGLGQMYGYGSSDFQDNVIAHMWYNIYASNGGLPQFRNEISQDMTPEQIGKAQDLAREWVSKHGD